MIGQAWPEHLGRKPSDKGGGKYCANFSGKDESAASANKSPGVGRSTYAVGLRRPFPPRWRPRSGLDHHLTLNLQNLPL